MKTYIKLSILILCFSPIIVTTSCKQAVKKSAKEVSEESIEKVTQNISKKSINELTEQTIKHLEWDDLLTMIERDYPTTASQIKQLKRSSQKSFVTLMKEDINFLKAVTSSTTIFDEYKLFSKSIPSHADNPYIFKWFVNTKTSASKIDKTSLIDNITLKESGNNIIFTRTSDNSTIGTYRDGIFTIEKPFNKNSSILPSDSPLRTDLIPNCTYKLKGANGTKYLYNINTKGTIESIKAEGLSPIELTENILNKNHDANWGNEWLKSYKQIKQSSKGNDIDVQCTFKYTDDNTTTPKYANLNITIGDKKITKSLENLNYKVVSQYNTKTNTLIISKFAKKTHLSPEKQSKLIQEMDADEGLAALIHQNPEFNILRWKSTRNHVDVSKIVRTNKGNFPPNAKVYAGNTYYFNPHLNSKLYARLKQGNQTINLRGQSILTYDDLIALDNKYPDGVPFSKEGFPDFTKVAEHKDGKLIRIDVGQLSGDSKKDISNAETIYQALGYKWEKGYTWHHIENSTSLIRVPTPIHQLVDHAGGMSTNR